MYDRCHFIFQCKFPPKIPTPVYLLQFKGMGAAVSVVCKLRTSTFSNFIERVYYIAKGIFDIYRKFVAQKCA